LSSKNPEGSVATRRSRKVLIANRGEIVLRIIRACKALGIKTVAIYAPDDKNRLIEKSADEYVRIDGESLESTYLNIGKIIKIAKQKRQMQSTQDTASWPRTPSSPGRVSRTTSHS
jgi:pyruvate carboxylase